MVRNVISTCRACRPWAKPSPQVMQVVEMTERPNTTIEADILFAHEFMVWHMIDIADRWHAASQIPNTNALTFQEPIGVTWLQIFGPFKTLVIDDEQGIAAASTIGYLKRLGISVQIRGKNQHARMI